MSNDWRRHLVLYVELLIVVASVSCVVCMAVLVPRVQQAREEARRAALIAGQAKERARLRIALANEQEARKMPAGHSGLRVKYD